MDSVLSRMDCIHSFLILPSQSCSVKPGIQEMSLSFSKSASRVRMFFRECLIYFLLLTNNLRDLWRFEYTRTLFPVFQIDFIQAHRNCRMIFLAGDKFPIVQGPLEGHFTNFLIQNTDISTFRSQLRSKEEIRRLVVDFIRNPDRLLPSQRPCYGFPLR